MSYALFQFALVAVNVAIALMFPPAPANWFAAGFCAGIACCIILIGRQK